MIVAKSIVKCFEDLKVLRGVNLEIKEGEIVAIVGPSGAGKSTLLHILGTLEMPDSGSISLDGINLEGLQGDSIAKFRNKNIGFVFQFHNLLPEFTALENAAMPCYLSGVGKVDSENNANKMLNMLGLGDKIHNKPSQLSGGERQRVAVARALVNNPKVIFADEPSGSLDSKNAKKLYEIFFSVREKLKQTLVFATHDMEFASLADRIIKIKDGNIVC